MNGVKDSRSEAGTSVAIGDEQFAARTFSARGKCRVSALVEV